MSVAEHKRHAPAPGSVTVAVVTVSDTRTEATDEGGRLARELCRAAGFEVTAGAILRDEPVEVAALVRRLCADGAVNAIILTGGTGISRRDTTFEALESLFDKELDGFGELFRALSFQEIGPAAMLSRATAGTVGAIAVFLVPGSPSAVRLALERLILPELAHIAALLGKPDTGLHGQLAVSAGHHHDPDLEHHPEHHREGGHRHGHDHDHEPS